MKLALTAGGTGGHIFPALAVLDALRARPGLGATLDVRFFGPDNRGERAIVEGHGVAFEAVPAAAVRGRNALSVVRSLASLSWGTVVALRRLRRFRPDAVFSTGGYASFPCSLAARMLRRPLVVFLPDVAPGWAVRAEQRLATRIATTTDAALAHLPKARTVVTGYPVRPAFFSHTRDGARAALGISPDATVLVVAGGSQGASGLNAELFPFIERFTASATVFHLTGVADLTPAQEVRDLLPPALATRYEPAAFRDDLPLLLKAADLAVLRAGASVLGEVPAAGVAAILVPGRYAGAHQYDNAVWLRDGGAAVIADDTGEALPELVDELLHDGQRRRAMGAAAAALARPGAAAAIGDLVLEVARR